MLLIWKGNVRVPVVSACLTVADLTWEQCLPPLPLWSLCGYLGSELGKIWCCGNLHGHHQRDRVCVPAQTWRASRRPGDTTALWVTAEKERINFSGEIFLLTGSCELEKLWFLRKKCRLVCVLYDQQMIWWKEKCSLTFLQTFLFFCCWCVRGIQRWPYPSWWYFYLHCHQRRSPKIFL